MSAEMALEFLPEEQGQGVSVRSTTRGGALAAALRLEVMHVMAEHEVRWQRNWVHWSVVSRQ